MDLHTLLTYAYGLAGAVGIAAYGPQAWALWRDESGSYNVPLSTWGMWGAQTIVYVLYAFVVSDDWAFRLIMLATFLATHLCLWLLVYNRYWRAHKRNRRADDPRHTPSPGDHY